MEQNFEKTKNWLFSSGVLILDENDTNCGGVYSFFDEKKNEFSFLYPEITGYFLSSLRFLYDIEKNPLILDLGEKISNWLIQLFDTHGGIIQGIYSSVPQNLSYSFDTSICAKGILDFYQISKNEKNLDFGKKLVSELELFIENDGTFKPLKNLRSNQFEESKKLWYKQKGCLHIKCAMPFFQLYQITKNKDLLKKGCNICDTYSKFQNPDGSFSLHLEKNTINLHTLCYAVEGLLYGYNVTKNEKYLNASIKAIEWALSKISDDGSILLWFNSKYKEKAAYPIAQLIRLIILLNSISPTNLINETKKLASFLNSNQAKSENNFIDGGFYEGFTKSIFGWKKIPKINSWTTMFSLQALYWLDNHEGKSFKELVEFLY